MESLDEIWAGDLFDRKSEAEALIGYLESVATRPPMRDEGHAHVLAVDTSYGHGKSFFLRRLARHMKADDHAVAFVDAWVDDLEDQPMVALVATLDKALEPWVATHPEIAAPLADFRARAGRVAKIVGVGLAKRAASFVIMGSGAEALADEMSGVGDVVKDLAKDSLKDASTELVDGIATGFGARMASSMEQRIERFREGQQAIADMKTGLSAIVDKLIDAGMKLPITIIIDELDRCRPTYAIKVLEEVKHLFDVPGVAFVLGLHGQQLAHSVTAAYGVGFDSQAYLRRFFNRRYVLREVALTPLVSKLIADLNINVDRLQAPLVTLDGDARSSSPASVAGLLGQYIKAYGLSARDAFGVMEVLQTTMALTGTGPILIPLIMPLIIAHTKDRNAGNEQPDTVTGWAYVTYQYSLEGTETRLTGMRDMFLEMNAASRMSRQKLMDLVNKSSAAPGGEIVAAIRLNGRPEDLLHDPALYEQVLQTVKRFESA